MNFPQFHATVISRQIKMSAPPLSVYIPAYNVAEFLPKSIESILAQSLPPDEILVIDDGSRDASPEIAARYPQVTLIRHERNLGLAAARNTAFRSARNEFVASLDADCVADPNWLAGLLVHFADPKIAGVGGRLIEGARRTVADRWRATHMAQEWGSEPIREPKFLFGCNNLFRKSAVLEAGGYDEAMRTNGEDADLSRRLRQQGGQLLYDPSALATHLRHDTIRSILDACWRWRAFGSRWYSNGMSLRSVAGHALKIHSRYFAKIVGSDFRAGRFELLGIDVLTLFYFPYREFRLWRISRTNPSALPGHIPPPAAR
jgi:glycosyltransferase involved in cell wall biosynthesis